MAKQIAIDIDIKGTKDVLRLQQSIKDTKKELNETKNIDAYDNLVKDLIKLQAQLKEARKRQRQAVDAFAATDKSVGAYSRLSAQLRVARNNLKDLAAEGKTTGEEVEKLTNEVSQLDTQLKDIDRSVGQTNREIGDYENAIRKATGLTENQTGAFTRLNGKLKVLKKSYNDIVVTQGTTSKGAIKLRKEIQKLETELKKAGTTAQKSSKRIGGVRTQLRNLGPAASGIASGFLIFSELPDILNNLVEGFTKFGSLLSSTFALSQALNESTKEAIDGYVDERLELENLFATASADNENKAERKEAINLINEQYGDYLPNLLTEKSSLEEITKAQKIATAELIKNIAARASREKLEDDIKRLADATAQTLALERQSNTTFGKIQTFIKRTGNAVQTLGASEFSGLGEVLAKETDFSKIANNLEIEAAKAAISSSSEFEKEFTKNLTAIEDVLAETFKNSGQIGLETTKDNSKKINGVLKTEAQKIAEEQARIREKAAEKAAKDRARFLQNEIKDEQKRARILLSLTEQLNLEILKNLEDGEKKQIALEENASQKRIAALKEENEQFRKNIENRIKKSIELFGSGSQKVLELEKSLGKEQIKVQETISKLIEQEEISSQKRILEIKKEFAKKENEDTKSNLSKNLEAIKQAANKVIEIKKQEEKEKLKIQKEATEKSVEFTLNSTNKALDLVDNFAAALNSREINRLQKLADERAQNIEGLQEQLENASGLEKAFLEQRVQQETQAAQEIAAQQERARKENAIAQKAIAIAQAVINGALAVTAILAQTVDPTPVQAFRFGAVAAAVATTAAQVATIAAQPLATGGIVGFNNGGKVTQAQNIKTQKNGDNVLATLKRREVVLTEKQQAKLGGAKTFAKIGVPGFASGGVVSPPIGPPESTNILTDINTSNKVFTKMAEMIEATNNRIDRIQVLYTTNTADSIEEDKEDKKEIKARSTL